MRKCKNILAGIFLLLCAFCALACMYPNNGLGGGVNAGDGKDLTPYDVFLDELFASGERDPHVDWGDGNEDVSPTNDYVTPYLNGTDPEGNPVDMYEYSSTPDPDTILIDAFGNIFTAPTPAEPPDLPDTYHLENMLNGDPSTSPPESSDEDDGILKELETLSLNGNTKTKTTKNKKGEVTKTEQTTTTTGENGETIQKTVVTSGPDNTVKETNTRTEKTDNEGYTTVTETKTGENGEVTSTVHQTISPNGEIETSTTDYNRTTAIIPSGENDGVVAGSQTTVSTGKNGETITTTVTNVLLPDGSIKSDIEERREQTTVSSTVTGADGVTTTTVVNGAGAILSQKQVTETNNGDGSVSKITSITPVSAGGHTNTREVTTRTYTGSSGAEVYETVIATTEWTGDCRLITKTTITEETSAADQITRKETYTQRTYYSPHDEVLYSNESRELKYIYPDGAERSSLASTVPITKKENGFTVITFPDGKTFIVPEQQGAKIAQYKIERTGLWEIVSRPTLPRVKMDQVIGADGKSNMRITYNNGQDVPFPVSPAVRVAKRTKASTQVTGETVPLQYDRAELWYKVLPQGTETDASVWHKIKEVSGEQLNRHIVDAPLKIFGSIDIPGLTAGDEVLFLLYLVDEDGEASGEPLTEGTREPIVTIPARKENLLDKVSSDQEYESTKHTTPFMLRVRYNGKRSLK